MILPLAISFALGVLATVLAGEYERKRVHHFAAVSEPYDFGRCYGTWTAGYHCSDSLTAAFGDTTLTAHSTLPEDK